MGIFDKFRKVTGKLSINNKLLEEILPRNLGFGLLDKDSIIQSKKGLRAKYYSKDGDLVYDISMDDDSCEVKEYFNNNIIGMTKSETLEKAFVNKFMHFDGPSHPRFKHTVGRLITDENIHFLPISVARSIFFPAGLIFCLWLPIVRKEREELIYNELNNRSFPFELNLKEIHKGTIIRLLTRMNSNITTEERPMAEFSATLFDLETAVETCLQLDLVLDKEFKEYGLIIMEASQSAPGGFLSVPGDGIRTSAYSLLLNRPGDISLDKAIKMYEDTYLNEDVTSSYSVPREQSIEDYKEAISLDPTNPIAFNNRGEEEGWEGGIMRKVINIEELQSKSLINKPFKIFKELDGLIEKWTKKGIELWSKKDPELGTVINGEYIEPACVMCYGGFDYSDEIISEKTPILDNTPGEPEHIYTFFHEECFFEGLEFRNANEEEKEIKTIEPYSKEWDEMICAEYFGSYRHLYDTQNGLQEEEGWECITFQLIDRIKVGMRLRVYFVPTNSPNLFYKEHEVMSELYKRKPLIKFLDEDNFHRRHIDLKFVDLKGKDISKDFTDNEAQTIPLVVRDLFEGKNTVWIKYPE